MGQVSVRVNGYVYNVGCQDGEEGHLHAMAHEIEKRVERIRTLGGSTTEGRTLLLAALLMADEIHDLTAQRMPSGAAETIAEADRIVAENKRAKSRLLLAVERAEGLADLLEHG
ncbi:cell division protein ZapA [Gluconobacter wancherniae]|uniref:cell division protein ZapA n=1 Tax=Gluconobacter wancherniae TaxID=1307955 RepID=UPI001B8C3234|nr:cell division protein ZapA [Gluconobacter wancherniae]MBS1089969.1 cell division protein ZapA [Gluconobacter wancherniae]MBS1095981.1 cell division protein ZapA [Gluconobacter wancherniae]